MPTTPRKKLIEVSIPLEAINKASAREKSIRHGHPSTLHLWWARRPLAACRAVLFAQLVDDPSSWPDKFPTEAEQEKERLRLHGVIERMVPWEASNDENVLNEARWEIARSVAWGLGEEPPPKGNGPAILEYLQEKAPPVYDPFSGGGSIPLEAQRLGLRAYGSDLNPVAVLIGKALVEIPPKFAGMPPVNPESQKKLKSGGSWTGKGAQGLAEDVRYYGRWMRDEAEKRIGHLYPKATLLDGSEATVIAWLWARTVRSPDPAAKGAMVPLVSSFVLSPMQGKKAWVEPVIDPSVPDGWRFEVKTGTLSKADEDEKKKGTKTGRGSNFSCVLTGSSISPDHVKSEGMAGRMGARLMAIVAEGSRSRAYLTPTPVHEKLAGTAKPAWEPQGELPNDPRNFWTVQYGLDTFASLFTPRQLVALTTFSDLVGTARERALADAHNAGLNDSRGDLDEPQRRGCLRDGGVGAIAYADAVATYLGLLVGKLADKGSTICTWDAGPSSNRTQTGRSARVATIRVTFARQALPMTWDYAEANLFSDSVGSIDTVLRTLTIPLEYLSETTRSFGAVNNIDAPKNSFPVRPVVISTDPPYYDNIGYADLSDFFYVWLKRSLGDVWPDLFRRLITPKESELVATPYRHGGKTEAESFFMHGMGEALTAMRKAATDGEPLAIYYAYKQAEVDQDGIFSPGWTSFLQAVVNAGLTIDGTWPVRTELSNRMIARDANALASSVVLACRKRGATASTTDRAGFTAALRRELPAAIAKIRATGVGPVDMQQSVIGPGMGVFTRYAEVLEDDDKPMTVRTALAIINRVWEELDNELVGSLDAETQVALAWFGSYGFDAKPSGELITLANAKNTSIDALFQSGAFQNLHGRASLTPRDKLPADWTPASDKRLTIWECVQHTARVLNADDGGIAAAGRLVDEMGSKATEARALIDQLFRISTEKGWAQEALVYNQLAEEWPHLLDRAGEEGTEAVFSETGDLFA